MNELSIRLNKESMGYIAKVYSRKTTGTTRTIESSTIPATFSMEFLYLLPYVNCKFFQIRSFLLGA
jgi:hypothetical protein